MKPKTIDCLLSHSIRSRARSLTWHPTRGMRRRLVTTGLGAVLVLCFALAPGASARPADDTDTGNWDFDLSLYGWLLDATGEARVGDTTVAVEPQIWNDILRNLNGAAFGMVEARYRKRWLLNTDLLFATLSPEGESGPFPISFGPATLESDGRIELETSIGDLEIPARLDPGTLRVDIPRVQTAIGPFDIETTLTTVMVRGLLGYRVVDAPLSDLLGGEKDDPRRVRFDLFGGIRYYYIKTEIKIEAPPVSIPPFQVTSSLSGGSVQVGGDRLPGRSGSLGQIDLPNASFSGATLGGTDIDEEASTWWVDPVVGARVGVDVCETLSFALSGNIGGFGIGSASDFSWETTLAGRYFLGAHWSLVAGYHALGYDRQSNSIGLNLIFHGPVMGFIYAF